jgi:hypothetical protein
MQLTNNPLLLTSTILKRGEGRGERGEGRGERGEGRGGSATMDVMLYNKFYIKFFHDTLFHLLLQLVVSIAFFGSLWLRILLCFCFTPHNILMVVVLIEVPSVINFLCYFVCFVMSTIIKCEFKFCVVISTTIKYEFKNVRFVFL